MATAKSIRQELLLKCSRELDFWYGYSECLERDHQLEYWNSMMKHIVTKMDTNPMRCPNTGTNLVFPSY